MRTINLSELKSNPRLAQQLVDAINTEKQEKIAKKKPKQAKAVADKPKKKVEGPIVVAAPPPEEKVVKVKHDDAEFMEKHDMMLQLTKQARGMFNQHIPAFHAMDLLFSAAYKYAEPKSRDLFARAKLLCRQADSNLKKRDKLKTNAKAKGKTKESIKRQLDDLSNRQIKKDLNELFTQIFFMLAQETSKKDGKAYNDLHKKYKVDLSQHDLNPEPVVLARSTLMLSTIQRLDLDDVKRTTKRIEVEELEAPIYIVRHALLIGFRAHCAPTIKPMVAAEAHSNTIDVKLAESLEATMATLGYKASPFPRMMKHASSNRIWFYVPEYSKAEVRSISFADRSLNSEFEAFRTLSNDPQEDDIRFIFLKTGCAESRVDEVIKRWRASDSHQTRLAILTNEYSAIVRAQKTERLRLMRLGFLQDNKELIEQAEKASDRIQHIAELNTNLKQRFSLLASHTGNAHQGLSISKYSHLDSIFTKIERNRVRGNTDDFDRKVVRRGIRKDRIECRTLRHEYVDNRYEAKMLRDTVSHSQQMLEHKRKLAFHESTGQ